MRSISTEVEIDVIDIIDQIDTNDLVEELKHREYPMGDLQDLTKAESIQDIIKLEAVLAKYKDIPESELDEFLNKY